MKTLLMTPSIALAFGLSGNAIAEAPQAEMPATLSLHEAVTHTKVSLVETRAVSYTHLTLPTKA